MELIVVLGLLALLVLGIRLLGAWMLRINELIKLLKDIFMELQEINACIRIDKENYNNN